MSYADKVIALAPRAYWRLNESSGTAVADSSGRGKNGTASGVTWGVPGIGDGGTAARFDGVNDYVNVYNTDILSGNTGSLLVWFRRPPGGWTGVTQKTLVSFLGNVVSNQIIIFRNSTQLISRRIAGGATKEVTAALPNDDEWHAVVLTWDVLGNALKGYLDGTQTGAAQTGLASWTAAVLNTDASTIGVERWGPITTPGAWDVAHVALWNVALAAGDVLDLADITDPLIPPVTDRTQADITNRAPKALWNVADWTRVTANTANIRGRIVQHGGLEVPQHTLTTPATGSWAKAADINRMVENIERVRAGAALGTPPLKHDYESGLGAVAPDYVAANAWEATLEGLYDAIPRAAQYTIPCGVAATGQPRHWQSRFRG